MYLKIIICFVLFITAGCASRNVGHNPKDFTPYTSNDCFILKEQLKYQEKRGLGYLWDQGLKAGVYKGALQDSNGYYFIGPEDAVCQAQKECAQFGKWPGGNGGIWMSKSEKSDIRLFVINDSRKFRKDVKSNNGVLGDLLIDIEHGKYHIFDQNKEFIKNISENKVTCE